MDEGRFQVREIRDSDYEELAALNNAGDPDHPVTAEYLRHVNESFRGSSQAFEIVVVDRPRDRLVGRGGLFRVPFMDDPYRQWIECDVHPEHRREGIGNHVFEVLLAEARRRELKGLRVTVHASSVDGLAFAARHGFTERRRSWRSVLEVTSADTSRLPALSRTLSAAGIELTTLSRERQDDAGVVPRVHQLMNESGRDVPTLGPHTPIGFEEFERFFVNNPDALPDAWFLAKEGDRYVGTSFASRQSARPKFLRQHFTGTLPEFRRRQIALTLKLSLIDYARRNGYSHIETSNDSLNEGMWSLNQRLGFRKTEERVHLERVIGPLV
jgi:mycothiol synthase